MSSLFWSSLLSGMVCFSASAHAEVDPAPIPLEPPALDCTMSTSRARAARLRPALQKGFGVQYWGEGYSADALAAQPHGLLILEATKIGAPYNETGREIAFTPEEIAEISHDGTRPVVGYLNVSEIETYRDYWIDLVASQDGSDPDAVPHPAWDGPLTEHEEHLAAYWTPEWQEVLLDRVDRMMATGVSGLFIDDVLHYYNYSQADTLKWPEGRGADAPSDAPELAVAMMSLVEAISDRARAWNCDAIIIVNNAVFIGRDAGGAAGSDGRRVFADYIDAIDAVLNENIFALDAHPHTMEALIEDFQGHGVSVLSLDMASHSEAGDFSAFRDSVTEKAEAIGFFPYASPDSTFDSLAPPVTLLLRPADYAGQ